MLIKSTVYTFSNHYIVHLTYLAILSIKLKKKEKKTTPKLWATSLT